MQCIIVGFIFGCYSDAIVQSECIFKKCQICTILKTVMINVWVGSCPAAQALQGDEPMRIVLAMAQSPRPCCVALAQIWDVWDQTDDLHSLVCEWLWPG